MFHAQMVSGNSFKTFSPLKLKTWTKHLCINKLKTSRHINTEWETSVDGSRSFRMSLKVDVPEENDQISIALHSSDLHCSFSLQSKGPFVPQPPGQHTSPPTSLHIPCAHSQSHPQQPPKYFCPYSEDRTRSCKVIFTELSAQTKLHLLNSELGCASQFIFFIKKIIITASRVPR